LNKAITEREVGGWERCDKGYRDNLPYQAITTVLNGRLPEGKRITSEQLGLDHKRDIRQCEINEQCEAAHIDESALHEAIESCASELKAPLLKAWQAQGSVERAAHNIASRIRAGSAAEVLVPFSRPLDAAYKKSVDLPQLREQIWTVVEAVSRACVIPGTEYKPGKRQEVGTDQAWLIRIRLLVAQNLPINGLSSNQDRHLKDEHTHALITQGVSSVGDPLQRLWQLVSMLVERYDPGRETPPNPQTDHDAFKRYCGQLNANLILDSETRALFFHLMTRPESDEVTDLLFQYLPGLISFISHEIDGPTEGLLIDSEDMLGVWIARWLYRTGHKFTDEAPGAGASQTTAAQENSVMTASGNNQNISITAGEHANVTVVSGQDRSNPAIHQRGVDPGQVLPLLEMLLKATAQEPLPPTELRREIRNLQTEIEDTNKIPSDFITRLKAAIPTSLTLGEQSTAILNNIVQVWQAAFGVGV
jgi:hypothetical protein